jgi:hypothetical protein
LVAGIERAGEDAVGAAAGEGHLLVGHRVGVGHEGADLATTFRRRHERADCLRPLRSDRAGLDCFLLYFQSANANVPEPGHEDVDRRNRIFVRVVVEMRLPLSLWTPLAAGFATNRS